MSTWKEYLRITCVLPMECILIKEKFDGKDFMDSKKNYKTQEIICVLQKLLLIQYAFDYKCVPQNVPDQFHHEVTQTVRTVDQPGIFLSNKMQIKMKMIL